MHSTDNSTANATKPTTEDVHILAPKGFGKWRKQNGSHRLPEEKSVAGKKML